MKAQIRTKSRKSDQYEDMENKHVRCFYFFLGRSIWCVREDGLDIDVLDAGAFRVSHGISSTKEEPSTLKSHTHPMNNVFIRMRFTIGDRRNTTSHQREGCPRRLETLMQALLKREVRLML